MSAPLLLAALVQGSGPQTLLACKAPPLASLGACSLTDSRLGPRALCAGRLEARRRTLAAAVAVALSAASLREVALECVARVEKCTARADTHTGVAGATRAAARPQLTQARPITWAVICAPKLRPHASPLMPRRPPCRFASKPPRLLLPEYLQLLEASPWLYDASGRAIDGGRRPPLGGDHPRPQPLQKAAIAMARAIHLEEKLS